MPFPTLTLHTYTLSHTSSPPHALHAHTLPLSLSPPHTHTLTHSPGCRGHKRVPRCSRSCTYHRRPASASAPPHCWHSRGGRGGTAPRPSPHSRRDHRPGSCRRRWRLSPGTRDRHTRCRWLVARCCWSCRRNDRNPCHHLLRRRGGG